MPTIDSPPKDLKFLQIDPSRKNPLGPEEGGNRRPIYIVLGAVVLLVVAGLVLWRIFGNAVAVEVQRPAVEEGATTGNVVLTVGGYIVAHHPIEVSSDGDVTVHFKSSNGESECDAMMNFL